MKLSHNKEEVIGWIKFLENLNRKPKDAKLWKVAVTNKAYAARVGRLKGGPELMHSVGYNFATRGGKGADRNEVDRAWLVLDGTVSAQTGTPISFLTPTMLTVINEHREEVEAEVKAIDGAPSVAATLRAMRLDGATTSETRSAAELVLTYVTNLLLNPRDSRVHRVRIKNPRFQQAVGRLSHGVALMESVGFVLVEAGSVLQLRPISGEMDLDLGATVSKEDGPNPKFKFPKLDDGEKRG